MSEAEKEPLAVEQVATPQAPVAPSCCPNFESATATTCVLCKAPICGKCMELFEHNTICKTCNAGVLEEIAKTIATQKDIPMAILGGFIGAALGAVLWAAVVIISNYQVGYVAIAVGFFAGQGVAIAVSRRQAFFLQIISVIWAGLGCILGNLVIMIYFIVQNVRKDGGEIEYFDSRLWLVALEILPEMFKDPFNYLWIALAMYFSWRVSAPTQSVMTHQPSPNRRPRNATK